MVDVELELLNREVQLAGKTEIERMKIGDAVANGVVDNEVRMFISIVDAPTDLSLDPWILPCQNPAVFGECRC